MTTPTSAHSQSTRRMKRKVSASSHRRAPSPISLPASPFLLPLKTSPPCPVPPSPRRPSSKPSTVQLLPQQKSCPVLRSKAPLRASPVLSPSKSNWMTACRSNPFPSRLPTRQKVSARWLRKAPSPISLPASPFLLPSETSRPCPVPPSPPLPLSMPSTVLCLLKQKAP